jgi:hypothetical protein
MRLKTHQERRRVNAEEMDRLLVSIAERIADYRQGEIEPVDQEHILAWLRQFDETNRCVILRETERLLSKTYIAREDAKKFIMKLTENEKLTGSAPKKRPSQRQRGDAGGRSIGIRDAGVGYLCRGFICPRIPPGGWSVVYTLT